MNSKDYRDTVLKYIDNLGEINKLEDKICESEGEASELKEELKNLKEETSNLKQQINSHKRSK